MITFNLKNGFDWAHRVTLGRQTFQFERQRYFYHKHPYSFNTEREVEVPLLKRFLAKNKRVKVLEVGNVSHKYSRKKTIVVDKYERGLNVFNMDAEELRHYYGKVDAVLSVSTLEHIGVDEDPQPDKALNVFNTIRNLASDDGRILITVPAGYHPTLFHDLAQFKETKFLKRFAFDTWAQVDYREAKSCQYGNPFRHANAIAVYLR